MAYKRTKGVLAQKMSGEKKSGVLPMHSPNKNYKNPRDYRVFNMGNEADPPLEMGYDHKGPKMHGKHDGPKMHGKHKGPKMYKDSPTDMEKTPAYMKSSGFKMKEGSPFQRNFGVGSPAKAAKPDYIDLDGDGDTTESMKKAAADKKSPNEMASPAKRVGTHRVFLDEEGNVINQKQVPSLRGLDSKYDVSKAKTRNIGTVEAETSKATGKGKGAGLETTEGGGTRKVVVQDGWDAYQNVLKNPDATENDKREAKNIYNLWKKQVGDRYANRDELISRALSMGKISSVDDLSRKYQTNRELSQLAKEVGLSSKKGIGITDAEKEAGTKNLADWQTNVVQKNVEGSLETGVTPILPGVEKIKESGVEGVTLDELDVDTTKTDQYGRPKKVKEKVTRDITDPTNIYGQLVRKGRTTAVKEENIPEGYEGYVGDKYGDYKTIEKLNPYSEVIYPTGGGAEPATSEYLTDDDRSDDLGYGQVYSRAATGDMAGEGAMFSALQESQAIVDDYEKRDLIKDDEYRKHKKLIADYQKQKKLRDE